MNIQTFHSVQQQCDGIAEIDYFFAKAVMSFDHEQHYEYAQVFMVLVALSYAQRQGHSCLPIAAIGNQHWWRNEEAGRSGFVFAAPTDITCWLKTLIAMLPKPACVRLQNGQLYTERYWQFEQVTQSTLNQLHRLVPLSEMSKYKLISLWHTLFPVEQSAEYDRVNIDWQQVAVVSALYQGLTVLSGGPGTGKTYTVARILLALQITSETPLRIVLAAPTGKAAQRLSESLNHSYCTLSETPELARAIKDIPTQAQTVHRLLGLREHSIGAKHNGQNKLQLDVLVVDESSMLDLALMTRLLRALPTHCRLILVGDAQQLPSVESGNVLPMLMPENPNQLSLLQQQWLGEFGLGDNIRGSDCSDVNEHQSFNPCILLARSHRFGEKLAQLASAINLQDAEHAWSVLTRLSNNNHSGIQLVPHADFKGKALQSICDNYYQVCCADSLTEAFTQAKTFRVLAAMRQGESGTESINQKIEDKLRTQLGLSIGESRFKGQLLIVTRNIHALGLYNGDIGIVWPDQSGKLSLCFEGSSSKSFRHFDLNRVPSTQSVYAMTIHKSQGSEFDHVMVVLPQHGGQSLLSKELLYTAVTRSQNRLSIVSDEVAFKFAVNNRTQRYSGLVPVVHCAVRSNH